MKRAVYKNKRPSRFVQTRKIRPDCTKDPGAKCTNSSIAESVQVAIVTKAAIGDFRKNMKAFLSGDAAVLLGVSWRPRGLVLPVKSSWQYGPERAAKRNAVLRAMLEAALQRMGD